MPPRSHRTLRHHPIHQIEEYERFVGAETIDRIRKKAEPLRDLRIAHVNSTYYGGGVAELLSSLTLLMSSVGLKTGWRAIHGPPDFFSITKKMHNALQGGDIDLTEHKMEIYEDVIYENAIRNHLDHDFVIIHDPQPLPMIQHYRKYGPWIWRCHIDLTNPHRPLWDYLTPFWRPSLLPAMAIMIDTVLRDCPSSRPAVGSRRFSFPRSQG
jgi:trehalose synthase